MAIYNKRIEFDKERLVNHYHRRKSLPDLIYGIIRFLGIIVQNIYCVSSYLVISWIFLLPISWVRSDVYSKAENYLYNSLLFIVSSWSLAAGATVVETGDEYKDLIDEPREHLLDCNSFSKASNQVNGHQTETKNRVISKPQLKSMAGDVMQKASDNSLKSLIDIDQSSNDRMMNSDINGHDLIQSDDNLVISNSEVKVINGTDNTEGNLSRAFKSTNASESSQLSSEPNLCINQGLSTTNEQKKKPRILLLCNHISTADVPLMMQSLSTLTNQSILWVLDAQFKPTNFGLVCSSHGDFFIAKDSFTDGSLRDQVLKYPDRNILVLFPEGGFWRKRLEGSNRYALKNGLPMTRFVTHPRFGAFKDLIDPTVGVTHIVDTTLLYDDIKNPLSILDIALGSRKEPIILNYKLYDRSKINPTEEWLREIWLEKDKLLQKYYEDRDSIFKRFEGTMRTAKLDWFKVLSVHLFYLLVCYLTICRLFSATSVTMLRARDLYYSNI